MSKSLLLQGLEAASQERKENVTITCYMNWKNAGVRTLDILAECPSPLFEGLRVRNDYLVGGGSMTDAYRIRGNAEDVMEAFNRLRRIQGLNASITKYQETKPISYYKQLEGKQVATKVLIRGKEGEADTLRIQKVWESNRATNLYNVSVEGKASHFTFWGNQIEYLLEKGEFTAEFIKYTLL